MDIMRPFRPHRSDDTDELQVIVESDDHEELVFIASSRDEMEAKLDDFHVWAS